MKGEESNSLFTKTKAKKSLVLNFKDSSAKAKILKEIKKNYEDVIVNDDKNDSSKYFIEFSNYKISKEAKDKLAKEFGDNLVKIESALNQVKKEKREKPNENQANFDKYNGTLGDRSRNLFEIRIPKIILRNLSFKFTEESLRTHMEKYGPINLVHIPKKEDGKMKGYGFITFENLKDATKAIEDINSKQEKILGTKMALDWCLPKNLFLKNTREANEEKAEDHNENKEDEENTDKEDEEQENGENDNDEDEDKMDDDEEEDDDEEKVESDENEDQEESDSEKENKKEKDPVKKPDDKLEAKKKVGTRDVQEKRTVFIRNLSFDADEASVKEAFSRFGPVKYVKLCYDKDLERPRGTAFIQFESNQSALDACAESDIFELDMRKLQIDMAVSRNQVDELVEEKKNSEKGKKDSRNLALAKEGVIYANSYEAQGLTKADLMRRQKLEASNKEKLKLLHYFVSPTRLSVHNIPIKCTDQELRDIFQKAISNTESDENGNQKRSHRGGIVECRIMRDLARVNAEGVCRSKGYGFVEFSSFELAKKALHATNNNPKLFDNGTRLIVQFSIEDMRALKRKNDRLKKSQIKLANNRINKEYRSGKSTKDNKKDKFKDSVVEEDVEKHKQKNRLKVHALERKLEKRKAIEEKTKAKKQKRVDISEKKLSQKEVEKNDRAEKLNTYKLKKRQAKREKQKVTRKLAAIKESKKIDNVDRLVDKLYQSKSKTKKDKKWYD